MILQHSHRPGEVAEILRQDASSFKNLFAGDPRILHHDIYRHVTSGGNSHISDITEPNGRLRVKVHS